MMRSLVRSKALRLKYTYGSQATDNYPNGCPSDEGPFSKHKDALSSLMFPLPAQGLLSFDHHLARKRVHCILFAARPMLAFHKGTWTYKVMFVPITSTSKAP
ncbi:hypothetical protein GE21DRAFT_1198825 [Neurospora crassa]|nr:hypothetical protein GE21DRAFT_1198825 [Neurospora crassa]